MTAPTTGGASPSPATTNPAVPDSGVDATAAAITGNTGTAQSSSPVLELRQATITAVDYANALCSVAIGGDSTSVPNVHYLSNYKPTVGDTCWCLINGPDILALDRDGKFGAAAYAGMASAAVATLEGRAGAYGDMATVGPQVATTIPASGRVLICVSADIESPVTSGGSSSWMAPEISGATTLAAADTNALMALTYNSSAGSTSSDFGHSHSFSGSVVGGGGGSYNGTTGTGGTHSHTLIVSYNATELLASRVVLLTGLTPGAATVTAKYRSSGGTAAFSKRTLWVLPL